MCNSELSLYDAGNYSTFASLPAKTPFSPSNSFELIHFRAFINNTCRKRLKRSDTMLSNKVHATEMLSVAFNFVFVTIHLLNCTHRLVDTYN